MEVRHQQLARAQLLDLNRLRLLDLDHHTRLGPDLLGRLDDLGTAGEVLVIGNPAPLTGSSFHQDAVPTLNQVLDPHRQHRHAVFVLLDLPRNAYNHDCHSSPSTLPVIKHQLPPRDKAA